MKLKEFIKKVTFTPNPLVKEPLEQLCSDYIQKYISDFLKENNQSVNYLNGAKLEITKMVLSFERSTSSTLILSIHTSAPVVTKDTIALSIAAIENENSYVTASIELAMIKNTNKIELPYEISTLFTS